MIERDGRGSKHGSTRPAGQEPGWLPLPGPSCSHMEKQNQTLVEGIHLGTVAQFFKSMHVCEVHTRHDSLYTVHSTHDDSYFLNGYEVLLIDFILIIYFIGL